MGLEPLGEVGATGHQGPDHRARGGADDAVRVRDGSAGLLQPQQNAQLPRDTRYATAAEHQRRAHPTTSTERICLPWSR